MVFGFVCLNKKPWESCSNGYFSTLNVGSLVVLNFFNISINILTDIMILQTQYTGRKCDEGKNIFKTGIIRKRLNWVHSTYKNSKHYCKMARGLYFLLTNIAQGSALTTGIILGTIFTKSRTSVIKIVSKKV